MDFSSLSHSRHLGHSKSHQLYICKVFQTSGLTFDLYSKGCMGIERTNFCSDFRILSDASKMRLLTVRGLDRMGT
jgi:hypothetical protein